MWQRFPNMKRRLIHLVCLCLFLGGLACAAEEDFSALRARAEAGDATAQTVLADKYLLGDGVPKDSTQAVKWFRKAAEKGDANGQRNLGTMYDKGEGVPNDDAEAIPQPESLLLPPLWVPVVCEGHSKKVKGPSRWDLGLATFVRKV